jgi:hypothetical protein
MGAWSDFYWMGHSQWNRHVISLKRFWEQQQIILIFRHIPR